MIRKFVPAELVSSFAGMRRSFSVKHNTEELSRYAQLSKRKWVQSTERFHPMSDRTTDSDLTLDMAEHLLDTQELAQWRGVPMCKCYLDFMFYPVFLQELQPRTILETGALCGASAVWMDDICRANLGDDW